MKGEADLSQLLQRRLGVYAEAGIAFLRVGVGLLDRGFVHGYHSCSHPPWHPSGRYWGPDSTAWTAYELLPEVPVESVLELEICQVWEVARQVTERPP